MSRSAEREAIDAAIEALERLDSATDAASVQALDAARAGALQAPWAPRPSPLVWASAAAAVLALVVGIGIFDRNGGGDDTLLAQQPVADAELYQEMEFYLWLSEELETD